MIAEWPVNYIEQELTVAEMLRRRDEIRKILTPIVLHSLTKPTQAEWNAAYVEQTGLTLPIPAGARLYWLNPISGLVESFTTVNDVDNGESSSGTIYETISSANYNQGALRLLGSLRSSTPLRSVHGIAGIDHFTARDEAIHIMPIDTIQEMQRGLLELWLVTKLGYAVVDLEMDGDTPATRLWDSSGGESVTGNYVTATTSGFSGGNATAPPNIGLASAMDDPNTGEKRYEVGFVRIASPVLQWINEQTIPPGPGLVIQSITLAPRRASGTPQSLTLFAYRRGSPNPLYNGIGLAIQDTLNVWLPSNQKAWLYGLYANNGNPVGAYL
ncbi:hypothetical protein Rctr85_100 [Virus Rctr85]|nr:hypothetical protein Rctr85_100 [Virus Rctr85]